MSLLATNRRFACGQFQPLSFSSRIELHTSCSQQPRHHWAHFVAQGAFKSQSARTSPVLEPTLLSDEGEYFAVVCEENIFVSEKYYRGLHTATGAVELRLTQSHSNPSALMIEDSLRRIGAAGTNAQCPLYPYTGGRWQRLSSCSSHLHLETLFVLFSV